MKRKIIMGILFVCCIMSLYGCNEDKEEKTEKDGYISYKLLEDDTYEVSKYEINDREKKIIIPEEYKGKKVTSIGECAFCELDKYKEGKYKEYKYEEYKYHPKVNKKCIAEEIELPETIKKISEAAFYYCEKLKSIRTGNNIKFIENIAFYKCTSLESFNNTDNLESLGEEAFSQCESLKKFKISDKLKDIPNFCFLYCKSLTDLYIGNNVENIGSCAFDSCESLKDIFIPQSVKKIGKYAFLVGEDEFLGEEKYIIRCEIAEQPDGWDEEWQYHYHNVLFGQKR